MAQGIEGGVGMRPGNGISRSAIISAGAALLFAYIFFVRPAQQQVISLEGHVNRLVSAVDALNGSRKGVAAGTSLLARLEAQQARLDTAEQVLARYEALQERLAAQEAKAARSESVVSRLDEMHGAIVASRDSLDEIAATLGRVGEMHETMLAGRGTIEAASATLGRIERLHAAILDTRSVLGITETTLGRIDRLHDVILDSRPAIDATVETVERIESLHDGILASRPTLDAVASTLDRVDGLNARVVDSADRVDTVGRSLDRIDAVACDLHAALLWFDEAAATAADLNGLCESLAEQRPAVTKAGEDLDQVVGMQQRLTAIGGSLDDAQAVITALDDLRGEMVQAVNTVGGMRRFMVDLMLLEPTFTRAVRALDPVVEFTQAGQLIGKGGLAILSGTTGTSDAGTPVIGVAQAADDETR